MQKTLIVIILSLGGNATKAQFVYFDSLYDSGLNVNELINSDALIEYEEGVYSVMATTVNPFTSGQLYYFEKDDVGNRIREFLIENEISGKHYASCR